MTEEQTRLEIVDLLDQLSKLTAVELARLHEIEQMMVKDVLLENRHLTCNGCARLLRALCQKARGEEVTLEKP